MPGTIPAKAEAAAAPTADPESFKKPRRDFEPAEALGFDALILHSHYV
jgi:hypothetical protein